MRLIYLAARLYPYWALALIIAFFQIGLYHRRLGKPAQWVSWGAVGVLALGMLLWFGFRGDKNTDLWLRSIGLTY